VGVEIELIGPDVEEVTDLLAEILAGRIEHVSRYEKLVHAGDGSPWRVELDFAYLLKKGRERARADEPPSVVEDVSEAVVRAGAEAVVPVEVVGPPLPLPELAGIQPIVRALRSIGALGTRAGPAYAFGMQLNPETPDRKAATILAYLRSFLCLQDWLLRESQLDLTRRLTRYVAPFSNRFIARVIDLAYQPQLARLIDDYLESNPTRNRALDLLPLFAELDEERVRNAVQDELVKARPAFHFRLPNCEIDDPSWGIHLAWAHWLQVEHLAADPERLAEACKAYAAFLDRPLEKWLGDWADEVEAWLTPIDGP
jgi:hypothetical protein